MFRLIPPAGAPISVSEISKILRKRFSSDRSGEIFAEKIKEYTKTKHCILLNSGRTALLAILKALNKMSDFKKNEVVMPAYTCFSVAAAVARSGLKIRLIDSDPDTLDYDYERLNRVDFTAVLAIIGCNLFGILIDWNKLMSIAREKKVYLIDDAAQSMGSSFQRRPSGSLGDAGFFSLGRGKNLSVISGGILLTDNDDVASHLNEYMKEINESNYFIEIKATLNIIFYSLFLKPRLYWIPDKMPFLKLGQTVFDENFKAGHLSTLQRCAATVMFSRLDKVNAARVENARALSSGLLNDDRYRIPGHDPNKYPIYLRLPVLARNKLERDLAVAALKRKGISASAMYPSTIRQIEGIEKYLAGLNDRFDGANAVVDRLFALPTHPYVKPGDIDRIINCLKEI
ncbi:MAG: DegT/DnrJ/EryC1/StrS family aminotransferase [Candidatus Zixiibacteriota bacterium]|nr:MAG: DegT/DnrJ/EryC1/StrS family aminotransferase [candidate division Zixibacteria bacterium]